MKEAGKLLLRTEPIVFQGNTLELIEDVPLPKATGTAPKGDGKALFTPRMLGPSKPKAGLGFRKSAPAPRKDTQASQETSAASSKPSTGKGQDDFRKMLGGK